MAIERCYVSSKKPVGGSRIRQGNCREERKRLIIPLKGVIDLPSLSYTWLPPPPNLFLAPSLCPCMWSHLLLCALLPGHCIAPFPLGVPWLTNFPLHLLLDRSAFFRGHVAALPPGDRFGNLLARLTLLWLAHFSLDVLKVRRSGN